MRLKLLAFKRNLLCLGAALLFTAVPGSLRAQATLGKIDFPVTGSPQDQQCFIRGVLALHSFWFEEAADQFRECTKADPGFMMGYWGEAMTYNHPLWAQQDAESARKVLAKITDTSKLTARERAYIDAVRLLYGQGDKLSRDIAYSKAMEKIHSEYPKDDEAACFYALSLLGTVRPGDKGFVRQMRAGAIALDVFQRNPDHPGAAHYVIHSFDDPEHAILALPAARRYAEIAPAAPHARHMPSHIFLQLGMWPQVTSSNLSAWQASVDWVEHKGLAISMRDYHSLYWRFYSELQQGQYSKARELMEMQRQDMAATNGKASQYVAQMGATYLIETQQWDLAGKIFSMVGLNYMVHQTSGGSSAEHMSHRYGGSDSLVAFAKGYAAAATGSSEVASNISALQEVEKGIANSEMGYRAKQIEIQRLELEALAASKKGDSEKAIETMKKAIALEETNSPPSGPPELIKPPHELFGEILLTAGRADEAVKMFAVSLSREPNRARSLIGTARALAAKGDAKGASEAYAEFMKIWSKADSGLPELEEARKTVRRAD